MALGNRMQRELRDLLDKPPEGVCCFPVGDSIQTLQAQMRGPPNTVYEDGWFSLSIVVPDRYPFEPPKVTFETPVYHPNIDSHGRICLDLLNMPPKGSWRPSLNIIVVLAGVRQLLLEPNPSDPLMADITREYVDNRPLFDLKARQHVQQHAAHQQPRQQHAGQQQHVHHSSAVSGAAARSSVAAGGAATTADGPPRGAGGAAATCGPAQGGEVDAGRGNIDRALQAGDIAGSTCPGGVCAAAEELHMAGNADRKRPAAGGALGAGTADTVAAAGDQDGVCKARRFG